MRVRRPNLTILLAFLLGASLCFIYLKLTKEDRVPGITVTEINDTHYTSEPAEGSRAERYAVSDRRAVTLAVVKETNRISPNPAENQAVGLTSLADNRSTPVKVNTAHDFHDSISLSPDQMRPYKTTIPGTSVTFTMVPIPSGKFTMGSPLSEPGRNPDEGPQHRVKIEAFWMGAYEVTWNEYDLFMFQGRTNRVTGESNESADAISYPSPPYVDMSFGMGRDGYPAISMTQHAANKYCEWLSARTGQFFRLPTEAEWEYACRAGTTTAYSFDDDRSKLGEYAWFADNAGDKYHRVGMKKPNPWGLYDMHGNVAEWCLDQYAAESYKQFSETVTEPWNKAEGYPLVVRGGSFQDDAERCRSASRLASRPSWKAQDLHNPQSIWYLTDAQFLGFRIVRPLKVPSAEEASMYWNSGVEKD